VSRQFQKFWPVPFQLWTPFGHPDAKSTKSSTFDWMRTYGMSLSRSQARAIPLDITPTCIFRNLLKLFRNK